MKNLLVLIALLAFAAQAKTVSEFISDSLNSNDTSGYFVMHLNGMDDTAITSNAYFTLNRKSGAVQVKWQTMSGTSNDTYMTMTGMPAFLRPYAETPVPILTVQETPIATLLYYPGKASISTGGVITLYGKKTDITDYDPAFTPTWIKGVDGCTISYQRNPAED